MSKEFILKRCSVLCAAFLRKAAVPTFLMNKSYKVVLFLEKVTHVTKTRGLSRQFLIGEYTFSKACWQYTEIWLVVECSFPES